MLYSFFLTGLPKACRQTSCAMNPIQLSHVLWAVNIAVWGGLGFRPPYIVQIAAVFQACVSWACAFQHTSPHFWVLRALNAPVTFGAPHWHAVMCGTGEAEGTLLQALFLNKCSMPMYLLLQDRCVWQGWQWRWSTETLCEVIFRQPALFLNFETTGDFFKSASSKCLNSNLSYQ